MTTQFGGSLELQGDATDLSSARRPLTDDVKTSHTLPKKKRGRPRKAIPSDALIAARTATKEAVSVVSKKERKKKEPTTARNHKKGVSNKDFFEDDYFDLAGHDGESSFAEDELTTLDEFEKLAGNLSEAGTASRNRLDRPAEPPTPLPRRKKVARRRQIDPATCERDYNADELEFMNALSEYKRTSGRMFPTCSEILEVLKGLGYEKQRPFEADW